MNKKWFVEIAIVTIILVVLSLFLCINVIRPRSEGVFRHQIEINAIECASKAYRSEFGVWPTGDNSTIMRALTGQNPKTLVFLEIEEKSISTNGAFLDPWGREYQIEAITNNTIQVISSGPDRILGTEDDRSNRKK